MKKIYNCRMEETRILFIKAKQFKKKYLKKKYE